jgi:hypothetical protein
MAKQYTLIVEETNVALPNRVTIEQQVAILAEIGVTVNEGLAIDDLIAFEDRDEFELQPYVGLVEALGCEIEREPFTPKCNRLWMCDYERIEDHGDYQAVIERLEIMTDCALGLQDIKDYVDVIEDDEAWVEFTYRGRTIHWDAEVDNDWLDPFIIVKYDALLKESRSLFRIYSNHTDYGQVAFFAAFTPEQKARFDEICKIKLILIEEQA